MQPRSVPNVRLSHIRARVSSMLRRISDVMSARQKIEAAGGTCEVI